MKIQISSMDSKGFIFNFKNFEDSEILEILKFIREELKRNEVKTVEVRKFGGSG